MEISPFLLSLFRHNRELNWWRNDTSKGSKSSAAMPRKNSSFLTHVRSDHHESHQQSQILFWQVNHRMRRRRRTRWCEKEIGMTDSSSSSSSFPHIKVGTRNVSRNNKRKCNWNRQERRSSNREKERTVGTSSSFSWGFIAQSSCLVPPEGEKSFPSYSAARGRRRKRKIEKESHLSYGKCSSS